MIVISSSVFITKNKKVLLVRENKIDKWGLPGGKLELGETLRECAARECREEAGIDVEIKNLIFVSQKPNSSEGNNVVRFVYSAKIIGEIPEKEMTYKFFSREEFERLTRNDEIRGKDVTQLIRDFYSGKIRKYNQEPEVFS
jgi:ADP-ribose pyrophosphatase YjhB (NUDIX family)